MSNKELLDWAVEYIEEWHTKYTHLRSDDTGIFYTSGDTWYHDSFHQWIRDGYDSGKWASLIEESFKSQVITKEEWQEAKQPKPLLSSPLKDNLIVMQEYARRLLAGEGVDGLEYYDNSGKWHTATLTPDFITAPLTYRFKPDEVIHKGGTYPRPLTKEEGDELPVVWSISSANERGYHEFVKVQDVRYNNGLVFKSEEDAKQAAKVMFNMGSNHMKIASRKEDMSYAGTLSVILDNDGRLHVNIYNWDDYEGVGNSTSVTFCNSNMDGGQSPNTRKALVALLEAMELDNLASPHLSGNVD